MRKLVCFLLLAAMAFLLGCGAVTVENSSKFTVKLTNESEDAFHGFGVEWYEDGQLTVTDTAMKKDFLFVRKDDSLSCELPINVENLEKNKEYSIRIYIIGTDHANYCMAQPMTVDPSQTPLELTISGTEAEGWIAE